MFEARLRPLLAWVVGIQQLSTAPGPLQVLAEYIYIVDGTLAELQSKTVVLEGGRPQSVDSLPQVELQTECGEVYLRPRSVYADPLRGGDHVLVLCDTFVPPQVGMQYSFTSIQDKAFLPANLHGASREHSNQRAQH